MNRDCVMAFKLLGRITAYKMFNFRYDIFSNQWDNSDANFRYISSLLSKVMVTQSHS